MNRFYNIADCVLAIAMIASGMYHLTRTTWTGLMIVSFILAGFHLGMFVERNIRGWSRI